MTLIHKKCLQTQTYVLSLVIKSCISIAAINYANNSDNCDKIEIIIVENTVNVEMVE